MTEPFNSFVFTDSHAGSNNQAIALAQQLGLKYQIFNLEYNILANLPNCVLPFNFIQIKSPSIDFILEQYKPHLIITASRRTAMVSAAIKLQNPSIKNINILKPNLSFRYFDLVILPQHDKNVKNKFDNIYRIIGALNNVNQRISETFADFSDKYANFIGKNYAVVLVGGNTKNFTFDKSACVEFYETLLKYTKYNNLKYFITYSRRTPEILKEVFESLKVGGHMIHDPLLTPDFNPYPAMLKNASFVISSCDSISMASEVASTGKPFYLHIPHKFKSAKHLTFAYQLSDLGIAKILTPDTDLLQEYNYPRLSEAKKAADYIQSAILSVK